MSQNRDGELWIGSRDGLSHFQLQPRGLDAGLPKGVLNIIRQVSVRKLPGRDVHRDIDRLFG